jgi:hypothetical protein
VNWSAGLLLAGALAAAALAILAGSNLNFAIPAGAAAVLLVALAGATRLPSVTVRLAPVRSGIVRGRSVDRVESNSLLRLRRAFGTGPIGRSSILATIRALERDLSPTGRTWLSLESERVVLELPAEQFRQWVDDRLQRIEAAT